MRAFYLVTTLFLMITHAGCMEETSSSEFYLFVGTYTGEGSEGIYLYKFNAENGQVDSLGAATGVANPSYLALSPDNNFLYAVNEMVDSSEASVSAFSFDREEESLIFLNKQSSRGGAPCYVSVDDGGNAVFIGNYLGGNLSMLPIRDDSSLGEASVTVQHEGSSVNENRQQNPHVHCTYISPDNRLFVADLGTDEVSAYAFNAGQISLEQQPSFTYQAEPGAGPRHLTFHPDGEFAYLVNELNGTVVAFEHSGDSLQAIQTVSTLPDGYEGAVSGADIHVSPDGRFLYASNREDLNNIVIYRISDDGTLDKIGEQSSGGVHPRNFMIDPTGNYLLAANRHTDNIVIFNRDKVSGLITPTGNEINISQPVCLKMSQ